MTESMTQIEPIHLDTFGTDVTALSSEDVVDLILDAVHQKKPLWIGNHNLHSIYLWCSDDEFRENYSNSDVRVIDGWPVLMFARLAAKIQKRETPKAEHRIGSSDWLRQLILRREHVSIIAVGGTPESARIAAGRINRQFPWVEWRAYDGYDHKKQDELAGGDRLEDVLAESSIILAGMGMPNQEAWIEQNRELFPSAVVANIGGCIDYISGVQPLAPRWMGSIGLEWLYRLGRSPRRLAHRYLVEPFMLMKIIARTR